MIKDYKMFVLNQKRTYNPGENIVFSRNGKKMSYKLRKIYKCNICGKRKLSKISLGVEGLPDMGWTGSILENGICLCDECSKAFKDLKMAYYNKVYI